MRPLLHVRLLPQARAKGSPSRKNTRTGDSAVAAPAARLRPSGARCIAAAAGWDVAPPPAWRRTRQPSSSRSSHWRRKVLALSLRSRSSCRCPQLQHQHLHPRSLLQKAPCPFGSYPSRRLSCRLHHLLRWTRLWRPTRGWRRFVNSSGAATSHSSEPRTCSGWPPSAAVLMVAVGTAQAARLAVAFAALLAYFAGKSSQQMRLPAPCSSSAPSQNLRSGTLT